MHSPKIKGRHLYKKPKGFAGRHVHVNFKGCYLDIDMIRDLAKMSCSLTEICGVLGVTLATFRAQRALDPRIDVALNDGRANGMVSIRRQQFREAKKGSVPMLIWLGKQLLSQKDKDDKANINNNVRVVIEHPVKSRI